MDIFDINSEKRIDLGFEGQKIFVLPSEALRNFKKEALLASFLCTQLGYFPKAGGHYYQRSVGFDEWVFIYCVAGSGWCETHGEMRKIRSGEVLLLPPQIPHRYGASKSDPWSILWGHAVGSDADILGEEIVKNHFPTVELGTHLFLQQVFFGALEVLQAGFVREHLISASASMRWVWSEIRRRNKFQESEGRTSWLREVLLQMHNHIGKNFSLGDLAQLAGCTAPHLCRCFKDLTGYSPMDYLQRLRMMKACEMMLESEHPISKIAELVGYEDPQYFSRLFKKNYGASPRTWRDRRVLRY